MVPHHLTLPALCHRDGDCHECASIAFKVFSRLHWVYCCDFAQAKGLITGFYTIFVDVRVARWESKGLRWVGIWPLWRGRHGRAAAHKIRAASRPVHSWSARPARPNCRSRVDAILVAHNFSLKAHTKFERDWGRVRQWRARSHRPVLPHNDIQHHYVAFSFLNVRLHLYSEWRIAPSVTQLDDSDSVTDRSWAGWRSARCAARSHQWSICIGLDNVWGAAH